MTKTILHRLAGVVAFVRRKVEVWFVLAILMTMGILGWFGFREVEATQAELCRAGHASAATKDKFIDVFVRGGNVDETNEFIVELRGYVDEERAQLPCSRPTSGDLTP